MSEYDKRFIMVMGVMLLLSLGILASLIGIVNTLAIFIAGAVALTLLIYVAHRIATGRKKQE
jgi:hypothetical protein